MGFLDYKSNNWGAKESISDALTLLIYSNFQFGNGMTSGYLKYGVTWGLPLTLLESIFGSTTSQGFLPKLPWNVDIEAENAQQLQEAGWTVITPEQLGYNGKTNSQGTYLGEKFEHYSDQAEVLGKFDDQGNLMSLSVSFRGFGPPRESFISDLVGDVVFGLMRNFLGIGNKNIMKEYSYHAFNNLLTDVADYAKTQGLSGKDILVTGYSLGGAITNSLAYLSDSYWDGFYSDANYITIGSPIYYEENEKVLNIGFENDAIFRFLEDGKITWNSIGKHDTDHSSTTDNIVSFDDPYILFKSLPFSILNPLAFFSHMFGDTSYGSLYRVLDSQFYDLTHRDSHIIIANLSNATRHTTWVEDLKYSAGEEYIGSTFIIGSNYNDKIRGGAGNDYIEGGAGNDLIQDKGGYNIIDGGSGHNTFDINSRVNTIEFVNDQNGTLYVRNANGEISIMRNIQSIKAQEKGFLWFDKDVNYQVKAEGLVANDKVVNYANTTIIDNNETIVTSMDGGWLLGSDGDDVLVGSVYSDVFVAGTGNDTIYVNGGSENTLLFEGQFGHDVIHDFGQTDKLVIIGSGESSYGKNYHDYLLETEDGLVLSFDNNSVTLVGVGLEQLSDHQIVLA